MDDLLQTEENERQHKALTPPSPSSATPLLRRDSVPTFHEVIADFNQDAEKTTWHEFILHGTALRDVLLRGFRGGSVRCKDKGDAMVDEHEVDQDSTKNPNVLDGIDENVSDTASVRDSVEQELHEEEERKKNAGIFADDQRIQSWVRRYSISPPMVLEGDMPLPGMNESQIKAMACMIGNRVSLVQGVRTFSLLIFVFKREGKGKG